MFARWLFLAATILLASCADTGREIIAGAESLHISTNRTLTATSPGWFPTASDGEILWVGFEDEKDGGAYLEVKRQAPGPLKNSDIISMPKFAQDKLEKQFSSVFAKIYARNGYWPPTNMESILHSNSYGVSMYTMSFDMNKAYGRPRGWGDLKMLNALIYTEKDTISVAGYASQDKFERLLVAWDDILEHIRFKK